MRGEAATFCFLASRDTRPRRSVPVAQNSIWRRRERMRGRRFFRRRPPPVRICALRSEPAMGAPITCTQQALEALLACWLSPLSAPARLLCLLQSRVSRFMRLCLSSMI